jgi:2-polyprenyl-3-methyl-5-hydroxy-6-metoxy-1,4-benzoquinol methylase
MQQTDFSEYTAFDISKTSVELTKDFIRHSIKNCNKKYAVLHEDFFNYNNEHLFDVVVMGEVLEHVENPAAFLRRIYHVAADSAYIFISTAINAPQPDHIYLFNNLNEIFTLFEKENFTVVDYVAGNAGNLTLEKAEKRRVTIVPAFILKKNNLNK